MTGKQIAALLVGLLAVVGLGVVAYQQLSVVSAPATPEKKTESAAVLKRQADAKKTAEEVPATPDTVVDDIINEAELDNQILNDEELGELSELEAEGSSVSDFGTAYEEDTN